MQQVFVVFEIAISYLDGANLSLPSEVSRLLHAVKFAFNFVQVRRKDLSGGLGRGQFRNTTFNRTQLCRRQAVFQDILDIEDLPRVLNKLIVRLAEHPLGVWNLPAIHLIAFLCVSGRGGEQRGAEQCADQQSGGALRFHR